jgi:hypothetical protein
MGALAHLFRSQDTKVVRDIFLELQDASQLLRSTRFRESVSDQAFNQLSTAATVLKEDSGCSELARFAERAALRTFNELVQAGERWSDDTLKQHFTHSLNWALSERRCISVTREGIMESTQRDQKAQLAWESKVCEMLLGPSASISKTLLSEQMSPKVRAPKRLFQPKPMTIETLTAPLPVLETPR